MTGPTFQFIDNASISRVSRKAIRSHVMKGKNLGKKRSRRDRRLGTCGCEGTSKTTEAPPLPTSGEQTSHRLLELPYETWNTENVLAPRLLSHVGDELSGVMSAVDVPVQERYIISRFMSQFSDEVYPPQFGIPAKSTKSIFVQWIFIDEAYFHSFIAMSAACFDFISGEQTSTPSNMHHLSTALRLVNEKLSSHQALSDMALASVIALCVFENVRDDISRMAIHFEGLSKMIELRGGFSALTMNPYLVEKIRRLDIDVTLQLGRPPRLQFVPLFPESSFQSPFPLDCDLPSPFSQTLKEADMKLYLVTRDIMKMARLVTSKVVVMPNLSPDVFQEMLTSLSYRLLDIDTIFGQNLPDPLAKAVHIIMLAFMTMSIIRFGRQRRMKYSLVSRYCASRLNDPDFFEYAEVNPEAHLWMLFVAESAILGPDDYVWLIPTIVEASSRLGITEWSRAKVLLGTYPWIPSIHEEPAHRLWKACFGPDSGV